MKNLETNKIFAALLVAGIAAMAAGKISSVIYKKDTSSERGYSIEVADSETNSTEVAKPANPLDLLATSTANNGAKIFNRYCNSCHTVEEGKNIIGPSLYGIAGAKIGSHAGYVYSSAMASHGGEWTYENLATFLSNPGNYVKGTKMTFMGLRKPEDIANIIVFLKENSPNAPALPSRPQAEPKEEKTTEEAPK